MKMRITNLRLDLIAFLLMVMLLFFKNYFFYEEGVSNIERRISDGLFILSITIPVIIFLIIRSYFKKK